MSWKARLCVFRSGALFDHRRMKPIIESVLAGGGELPAWSDGLERGLNNRFVVLLDPGYQPVDQFSFLMDGSRWTRDQSA